jgi:hypothetical protein
VVSLDLLVKLVAQGSKVLLEPSALQDILELQVQQVDQGQLVQQDLKELLGQVDPKEVQEQGDCKDYLEQLVTLGQQGHLVQQVLRELSDRLV